MAGESEDVVVVGAGIVGLMAARALQADGRRVLVVDRGEVAGAASRGNAGMLAFPEILPLASPGLLREVPRWLLDPLGPLAVRPGYALKAAPWLLRFWRATAPAAYARILAAQTAMMRLARAEMGGAIEAAGLGNHVGEIGTLDLYDGPDAFARSRPDWELKRRAGIPFEVVSGAEAIGALQPGLAPRFLHHAVFAADGLQVREPQDFARALWRHIEGRGATLRRGEVRAISPAHHGASVVVEGGPLAARTVVLAGGAWSKRLAAGLGDPVPLETERGYNTTLPPGAFDLRRQIYFNGHGFVATPIAGGVRIGGAVEIGGLDLPPNFKRSAAMLGKAAEFLPGLRTEGGTVWMGHRPSMPDTLPVIGVSSGSRDVLYAFGHGHLGLTQSAGTGRLVADLVAGRAPAIDPAPFSATRFR